MISICIPVYNGATTILESLKSAASQDYDKKEILIVDQNSTDGTGAICQRFMDSNRGLKIRYVKSNAKGISANLIECMNRARGAYVIYLCADDLFVDSHVVSDYVATFDAMPNVGVVGHYFYQFVHGSPGAVLVSRDRNIITSSTNPSGMAFRKDKYSIPERIFVEMPLLVAQAIEKWEWTFIEYDTIAVRLHNENTAVRGWYYTESPTQNWIDLVGKSFKDYPMFIQLKLRAPKMLWREICLVIKNDKRTLLRTAFYIYALVAIIVPSSVLLQISRFYRHRLSRLFAKVIERPN